jgi:transcriptional regulator with GAF, ATPase, and Fis domain
VNDARRAADPAALREHLAHLVELASATDQPLDVEQVLGRALRAVSPATAAGLTVLAARGRPETWAAAGELPGRLDALQHSLGDGPFVRAVGGQEIVRIDDLSTDPQCATFGPRCAAEFNIRSIVTVPVAMTGAERGALSLYAPEPAAFREVDVGTARVFAPFAGLAVQNAINARKVEQLEIALQSSRQIGTAVGILMARQLLTADEAFARMSRASQQLNRKLREIAEWVERTGALPGMASDSTTKGDQVIAD